MLNTLGFSVYLSNFDELKEELVKKYKKNSYIFTSFHISEEMGDDYCEKAIEMCRYLKEIGYSILADVSKKTLNAFQVKSLWELAEMLGLDMVRIDYGFSEEEIIEIGNRIPICVNATTVDLLEMKRIMKQVPEVYAMHNFYPRPETGLDEGVFSKINHGLREAGVKVLAFIPGDIHKRGPIFESLPTLECHRKSSPYASYVDLKITYGVDGIFAGDGVVSVEQLEQICYFETTRTIKLPVTLLENYHSLYEQVYTIRIDSPRWAKRLAESREYSCFGREIMPENCTERKAGSVTVDNVGYARYSGEIQIVTEDLAEDERVNVIGVLSEPNRILLKNCRNRARIVFTKPMNS